MSWAKYAIEKLALGENATINPKGNSMKGKVDSGDTVVLSPTTDLLTVGQIVLVKCSGNVYLHLIKAVKGEQYQIGNNKGGTNGWVTRKQIYGVAISVEGKAL